MPSQIFTTTTATAPPNLRTYTLGELVAAVKHALGRTPNVRTTPEEIVNNAIQILAAWHPWTWRQQALLLDAVAAQAFVNLPADFSRIHTLKVAGSLYTVQQVTLDVIQEMRASPVAGVGGLAYFAALTWQTQSASNAAPLARLELYPTPSAATTGAFFGTYLRAIKELVGNDNVPDIRADFHVLLHRLCRAVAVSDEEQQEGEDWRLFNLLLPKFIDEDGGGQRNLGRMRGVTRRTGNSDYDIRGTVVH